MKQKESNIQSANFISIYMCSGTIYTKRYNKAVRY